MSKQSKGLKVFLAIHVALTVAVVAALIVLAIRGRQVVDAFSIIMPDFDVVCWSSDGLLVCEVRTIPATTQFWSTFEGDAARANVVATAQRIENARGSYSIMGITIGTKPIAMVTTHLWMIIFIAIQGVLPFVGVWMWRDDKPAAASPPEPGPNA